MKKMKAPEMEVVHFGPGDVIATSGGGAPVISYSGFQPGEGYTTVGLELSEGGYSSFTNDKWYSFKYDSGTNSFYSFSPVKNANERKQNYYTWFQQDTNTWLTTNSRASESLYPGNYPTN